MGWPEHAALAEEMNNACESVAGKHWRWRKHGPPKRWYPTTSLYGVTTEKTTIWRGEVILRA